ncbi:MULTISPECIES: HAD family hydrolase [Streptomyces]|uniref:HAD family hydrolase n=1 Tax=Streptomyces morookaense TaxID=1970 RepID=A0A7Y7BAP9_STRMO|nr:MULTISPECIES: HAD family hydrolase [Streptomyces]MCC2277457.1 HAD family hydrolase [Streptomyces sp. ET3-23]NVK82101.1 HAD family hydrolase [Streptomyces morookaense]
MTVRAVLWDVDDTLFDYTGSDRAGALRHIEAEGLLSRYDTAEQALGLWREVMEVQFARFLAGELGFREHRRERARAFLGAPLGDREADAWFARYIAHYEAAWTLFPDARPALDALAPHYRQAVLSNSGTRHQKRKLRALGVRRRFERVLCADRVGWPKPDPRAFHAACAALRLAPGEVVYVGDQLQGDAVGARDAGLHAVWLDRTGEAAEAVVPEGVRRIGGLGELPLLLRGVIDFGAPSTFG